MRVSFEKEISDSKKLARIIEADKWIDGNTIIVNCSPDYSSIVCQIVNHELSRINKNELFEMFPLEMPYPNMTQVWNKDSGNYENFSFYLDCWIKKYLRSEYKYLFIDSGTIRGKNFTHVKSMIKGKSDIKFGCLYLQDTSIFTPDYYVEKFNFNNQGELVFEWENLKNPNW